MERVSHKIEGLIQAQRKMMEQSQAAAETHVTKDKSKHVIAIVGFAAGLTVAIIGWLANSIMVTDPIDMSGNKSAIVAQRGELEKLSDHIAQLNARVESLAGSVYSLEAGLTRVLQLTASVTDIDAKQASSAPQQLAVSAFSWATPVSTETEKTFNPTHSVRTRVNLRPTASLTAKPITVLSAGTEVEYIGRSEGWYRVNTRSNGKGWCSSVYLSPLPSTQRSSSFR